MSRLVPAAGLALAGAFASGAAGASDLSYTFLDFQYVDQSVSVGGSQQPVPGQVVAVRSTGGDGVAIAGSLGIGERLYVRGRFTSSIVDVTGTVASPRAEVRVGGDYDLLSSDVSLGYRRQLARNLDLLLEVGYDSVEYDFGSFAGENFDVDDSGAAAGAGFRWNPVRAVELFASSRYSPVREVDLDALELDGGAVHRVGVVWYFLDELGLGVDYESAGNDNLTVSMRFSFGTLDW